MCVTGKRNLASAAMVASWSIVLKSAAPVESAKSRELGGLTLDPADRRYGWRDLDCGSVVAVCERTRSRATLSTFDGSSRRRRFYSSRWLVNRRQSAQMRSADYVRRMRPLKPHQHAEAILDDVRSESQIPSLLRQIIAV